MSEQAIRNHAALIWSVAETLRGDFKQSEYQRVVLPFVVLRRLDAVLEDGKAEFLERAAGVSHFDSPEIALSNYSRAISGVDFYNTGRMTFRRLTDDPDQIAANLRAWIRAFSSDVVDVMDHFNFDPIIDRLDRSKILYRVVSQFADVDLHPDRVSNTEMGYLYEELVRRFSELSNETAGEHFTPREVIRLMVNLLVEPDAPILTVPGLVTRVYDPACGTGGMLTVAEQHIRDFNPRATVAMYGQELNPETYAVCRSDMMVKGADASRIAFGNSFTDDGHAGETFDYLLANPPFGVDWGKYAAPILDEAETKGYAGRFGAGTPRKSDGSMLFLQHMISKMKPVSEGGSRVGIVFNASPLFTGAAGGGESEIRRWIIENDWLEAIVALPEQLFYNTGIATYIWLVTNNKAPERRGFVQLIDARDQWTPMRKSLGDKRRELSAAQIEEIARLHGEYRDADPARSKVFPNHHFGYLQITVEQPKRRRWEATEATLAAAGAVKEVAALSDDLRVALLDGLAGLPVTTDQAEATAFVKRLTDAVGMKPAATKKIVEALGVRDADAPVITSRGKAEPDVDLRDTERVPLPGPVEWTPDPTDRNSDATHRAAVDAYMESEVLPWVPDAWVDHTKTKIGYEIPFTREFYVYTPPRPLGEIRAEIEALEREIAALLGVGK